MWGQIEKTKTEEKEKLMMSILSIYGDSAHAKQRLPHVGSTLSFLVVNSVLCGARFLFLFYKKTFIFQWLSLKWGDTHVDLWVGWGAGERPYLSQWLQGWREGRACNTSWQITSVWGDRDDPLIPSQEFWAGKSVLRLWLEWSWWFRSSVGFMAPHVRWYFPHFPVSVSISECSVENVACCVIQLALLSMLRWGTRGFLLNRRVAVLSFLCSPGCCLSLYGVSNRGGPVPQFGLWGQTTCPWGVPWGWRSGLRDPSADHLRVGPQSPIAHDQCDDKKVFSISMSAVYLQLLSARKQRRAGARNQE